MGTSESPVESIFFAALAKEASEERAAYLDEACASSPDLRRRVERLLAAHPKVGSFLQGDTPLPAATLDVVFTHEGPGAVIGPYQLMGPLGEGGMGTVYLAEQAHPVQRRVALKLIRGGMDSAEVVARFEQERQALALMDHPNIAKVYDPGTTDSGRPYFVMELVQGVPITRYCDEQHLTTRQRLELFIPVCQAVQHAHHKGVIHRDLKPSNILVASYDGRPVPKVIDFGIAKATGPRLTGETLHTEVGSVVGTLEYMSPEQAEPNQLDVDTRSDVYSLGVLLYELLTGTTPLERARLKGMTLLEVLRVIREEESPRPSTRLSATKELGSIAASRGLDPRKLSGLVRGELDWIVMKALEKDRNCRYETANNFAADVRRYLADEPVQACPPSPGYRLRKFVRRHRAAVAGAVVVLVVPILLAVIAWVSNWRINQALTGRDEALARLNDEQERTAGALARETRSRNDSDEALVQERLALYSYRVSLAQREWYANHVGRAESVLDECPAPLRGWEWHYLKRLCHADLVTIRAHDRMAYGATFSPDGKLVASCGADGLVRIWDGSTGREVRTLRSSAETSRCPLFSPDGRLLVAACDRTIRVWDAATGQALRSLDGHDSNVFSMAFSPDGRRLAASTNESVLLVWDVATGRVAHTIRAKAEHTRVRVVAFSRDGADLVWVEARDVVVSEAATGRERQRWSLGQRGVGQDLAFSPDGRRVATGGGLGMPLVVRDLDGGKEVLTLGRGFDVRDIAFSPDGQRLATAHTDQTVRVWDPVTGAELLVLRGHTAAVHSVAFDSDGGRLVTASADRSVKVWDATAPQDVRLGSQRPKPKLAAGTTCMAVSPDGRHLALGGGNVVLFCESVRSAELGRLATGHRFTSSVAFSRDGRRLATGHADGTVLVWDVADKRQLVACPGHDSVIDVAFSKGGLLASAGTEGKVILRDAAGTEVRTLTHAKPVVLAFSPDGQRLATCETRTMGKRAAVRIWDVATWRELHCLPGHEDGVMSAVFSPDGKILASASVDRQVKLWDAVTGTEVRTLHGHANSVTAVVFHPTGRRLAAGTGDGTVVIWDLTTGREALTLHGGEQAIRSLAFLRDGTTLAAASFDGFVRLWDGQPLEVPPKESLN